jgi:HD superfamily phosphohydrolase
VNQHGCLYLIYPQYDISRYEHSIGVWYLLKRYGASIQTQIAGLLHDVSHTAFSHVIDHIFDTKNHGYQDSIHHVYLKNTDIPDILTTHGFCLDDILHMQHPLLDADLPALSADRIDYSLRDAQPDKIIPLDVAQNILTHIKTDGTIFYMDDVAVAQLHALLFMTLSRMFWLGPDAHSLYALFAQLIKDCLDHREISMQDIHLTDDEFLQLLKKSKSVFVQKTLKRFTPKTRFEYTTHAEAEISTQNKPRSIDPLVQVGKKRILLSTLSSLFHEYRTDFLKKYTLIHTKQIAP